MFLIQATTITLVFIILSLALIFFLNKFKRKDLLIYVLIPLVFYVLGFFMRLSQEDQIIDLGFFFTEISGIWLYILFTLALILGQVKYWRK